MSESLILAIIVVTFFAAGAVKGVIGMGLPTVAMGVLGALISPLAAASLLIVPSLVTNLWQCLAGPAFGQLARRLWPMMLTICIGTLIGTAFLARGDTAATTTALGAALIIYAGYTLLSPQRRVASAAERWFSPLVGLLTGIVSGATGIFVIPAVPYLQALGLARDDLVQALGLSFTVSTLALAAGLGLHGVFAVEHLGISALALIPALVGMWAGQRLRKRLPAETFRRIFLLALLLLGMEMSSRALS